MRSDSILANTAFVHSYQTSSPPPAPHSIPLHPQRTLPSNFLPHCPSALLPKPHHPKPHQPIHSNHTQSNRQRLLGLNRPGQATPRQHRTGQQRYLRAIGLAGADALGTEGVQSSDADAGDDGGDGARADVACDAPAGGEDGEEEGFG